MVVDGGRRKGIGEAEEGRVVEPTHGSVRPRSIAQILSGLSGLNRLPRGMRPTSFAVADPELFGHSMQAPPEWSARGFELEMEKVKALPDVVPFAIVLAGSAGDGRAIGRTTFMDIKSEHRGVEIGRTWIDRANHGTRVNPEAKYLMLRHAFEVLSPTAIRVQLTTNGTNLHSQAAIAKLGAVREGVLRKARIMPPALERAEPAIRDWVVFSILDEEWPAIRKRLEERLEGMV